MQHRLVASIIRVVGWALVAAVAIDAVVLACSNDAPEPAGSDTHFPLVYGDRPTVAQLTALGRRMFFDQRLSASGRQSCASCHDPGRAFGPPGNDAVQKGGPRMDQVGFRVAPSLTYLHSPVAFTEHFYESEVSGGKDDEGPTGGRTWDGRVNAAHDQALMPLFDPREMANADRAELLARLARTDYADAFRDAVSAPGDDVMLQPEEAVTWMTVALATFEQSAEFHAFTSKYDAYLRDEVELSPAEQRGLTLFNDMKKGNCASCHPGSHKSPQNHFPIFTDFGFVALGVPRNRELPANQDPAFHDLGLCGPLRADFGNRPEYCGLFRTPSLRNTAMKTRWFHNGSMRSLRDVVAFYATRDTDPGRWYGRGVDGHPKKYDDLPEVYWKNLNDDVPFKPRADGRPRLTPREIDDIVAFLKTLNDGYTRPKAGLASLAMGPSGAPPR